MKLKALDLFCGAGGLTRGLTDAGFQVVGAVDSWSPAIASYRANYTDHPSWTLDASALDAVRLAELGIPPGIDLVAGGPPCQGFSMQRIGNDEDARNDLVLSFGRTVRALNARAFMLENVRGLLGARGKPVVRRFLGEMEAAGYKVKYKVLEAADFGVPQARQRVFFVGLRADEAGVFDFPEAIVPRHLTVAEALADLGSPPEKADLGIGDPLHRRTKLSDLNKLRLTHVPPGGGMEDIPVELRVNCHKAGAGRIGHRGVYGRLHPDRPAGTITARFDSFTRGRFAHPFEDRNITLREGARLQGFDDSHRFLGSQEDIAAQIGNAIPPALARGVALAITHALAGQKQRGSERHPPRMEELPLFALS